MSLQGQHIIKTATIDFQYNGNTEGLVLQQEVMEWVQELVQQLETQFDAIAPIGSLLSIDKLEVEVDLSGSNWREEATTQVLKQWKEKLPHLQPSDKKEGRTLPKGNERVGHLFLFYLQQGHLPWQATSTDRRQWTSLLERWLQQATSAWVTKLSEVMHSSKEAKARFITIVPFEWALTFFSSFAKEAERVFIEDYSLFFKLAQKSEKRVLQHIYLSFLSDVFKKEEASYLPFLLARENTVVSPFIMGTFQSALFKQVQEEVLLGQSAKKSSANEPSPKSTEQEVQKLKSQTEQAEGIYISNAGLVVVAAFLPALFNALKLTPDGQNHASEYAVCLVNYLATGKKEMQEFELVLPKVLCGIPLETVVDPTLFSLNEETKREIENVLSSVIEHWSVLKNTSIQGLQESFLQREGKLVQKGNNWNLHVEQKAYDMLLQQLPWNMSMVKFPWMSGLLTTEWVY